MVEKLIQLETLVKETRVFEWIDKSKRVHRVVWGFISIGLLFGTASLIDAYASLSAH